jgi:tRNA 2-thiouridine synthesizing protein B
MLHIINKSPLERPALAACLRIAEPGTLLLIEDGVYAAVRGAAGEARLVEAMARHKLCVLKPDAEARAIGDRLIDGVTTVDYEGFVDLVAENKNCQSWL